MNSFKKQISFQIDQRYAKQVKKGKPFNPLLQPAMFGWYVLSVLRNLFSPPDSEGNKDLSGSSKLMRLFGHNFFPDKYSLPKPSAQEIYQRKFRFSGMGIPKVTFLVLCGDRVNSLVRLLESIEISSSGTDIELVLIRTETEDEVAKFIENNIQGPAIFRVSDQENSLSILNLAVANSKGEFFVALTPSVLLQPNWLRTLLTEINKDQNIGMVSGKVLSTDGLLDEAGTFVDSGFHLHNYGKSDFPERPKYNFIREIECTAGSNNLVRKSDFEKSGGFDVHLPSLSIAFCKLSLAFRQNLGRKIIFTPQAEVINHSHESDAELPDLLVFLEGVGGDLVARSLDDDTNARILLNSNTVLFIDIGLPEYDRDSGSLRAFYLLKLLRELGMHVIVVPRKGQAASPYFEELINLGIEVLYGFPDRKGMMKELTALLPSVDICWICRPQLNAEFEWIFEANPMIKWVFDTIDLHYVRLAREAELFKTKKLMRKSARFKKLELAIASKADLTLTVTDDERKLLKEQGVKNVAVIPNIHESHHLTEYPEFSQREGLLFIGSYHHPPNVDAVKWLVEEIMPIVWERHRIPVTLLGNAPGKEVKALETDLVKVPGYVKDIEPYFANHRVFVAPLRYGAGMKGKIGQSLAYKLPIVTTAIGAEGVGLTHGLDVLIAEDKESFAQQIIQVYMDGQLWRELASNSEKVLSSYRPDQIKGKLQALIEGLL